MKGSGQQLRPTTKFEIIKLYVSTETQRFLATFTATTNKFINFPN